MSTGLENTAILANSLTKKFPGSVVPAVNHLDLQIMKGESVAFLGPNGAGKSTTIKMLCGILIPDRGEAFILGEKAGSAKANLSLGLVFGARSQLYFHMTVEKCLELQAEIYFVYGKDQKLRIGELAECFQASHLLKRRVRELSLGERMRCEIVASLLHRPQVILLDEPTIGLDVNVKLKLRHSLKDWQSKENTTMLLTSHDLSDVEALCDRCVLINHGVKTYDGKLNQVKGDLAGVRRVKLLLNEEVEQNFVLPHGVSELSGEDINERSFEFHLEQIPLSQVMDFITAKFGPNLQDIQIMGVRLEEIIQKHYGQGH